MSDIPPQVLATDLAIHLIRVLRQKHGALMFHQSGGCCDGSSPMCYPRGEFWVGDSDVQLGEVDGEPFYMSKASLNTGSTRNLRSMWFPAAAACFRSTTPRACASSSARVSSTMLKFATCAPPAASEAEENL